MFNRSLPNQQNQHVQNIITRFIIPSHLLATEQALGQNLQLVRFENPSQNNQEISIPESSKLLANNLFSSNQIDPDVQDLFDRACSCFKKKEFRNAYMLFNDAFKKQRLPIFKANMSLCFKEVGATLDALSQIKEAISLSPSNDKFLRLAGILNFNIFQNTNSLNNASQCLEYFSQAFENNQSIENRHNYLQIRKIWTCIKIQNSDNERQELIDYLSSNKSISQNETKNNEVAIRGREILNGIKDENCSKFLTNSLEKATSNDIPQFLIDPITMDLPLDPVITPSGNSFNESAILNHIKVSGCIDPISRQNFTSPKNLVENKILKKIVFDYIIKNPWTFNSDECYLNKDFSSEWKFAKFL